MARLLDRVTLARIDHHLGRHAPLFQSAVEHQPHGKRATAVVARMEDQRRRPDLRGIGDRAVAAHRARDLPRPSAEFPLGPAPQVAESPHDVEIGHRVHRDGRLELPRMAHQPRRHEAAVAGAKDELTLRMGQLLSDEEIHAAQEVPHVAAAEVEAVRIDERLTVSRAAPEVRLEHEVALGGEDLRHEAESPNGAGVGTAVRKHECLVRRLGDLRPGQREDPFELQALILPGHDPALRKGAIAEVQVPGRGQIRAALHPGGEPREALGRGRLQQPSLAGRHVDRPGLVAHAPFAQVRHAVLSVPAVVGQGKRRNCGRRPDGAVVVDHHVRPRSGITESQDPEVQGVAVRAFPRDAEVGQPSPVGRESRADIRSGPRRQRADGLRFDVDGPEIEVLVDAVAGRLAVGRAVRVDDDCPSVGRPVRASVPDVVAREPLDAARRAGPRGRVQISDPHLGRPIARVALALVGTDDGHIRRQLLRRARVKAVVGHESQALAVGREDHAAVKSIREHTAVRLVRSRERQRLAAVRGDHPQVRRRIRLRGHRRRRRPPLRTMTGREERDPAAVGREQRRPGVGLARFQGPRLVGAPVDEPQRAPILTRLGIDPGARKGGLRTVLREDDRPRPVHTVEIFDGNGLLRGLLRPGRGPQRQQQRPGSDVHDKHSATSTP